MYLLSPDCLYWRSTDFRQEHGFLTRKTGSNLNWNQQQLFFRQYFGQRFDQIAFITPHQVHSNRLSWISQVKQPGQTTILDCDGLLHFAQRAHPVCLYVKWADCLTMLLSEEESGLIGAVHLGYRGLLNGMVAEVATELRRSGVDLSRLQVALGPSIGGCCYNIPLMRKEQFAKAFPNTRSLYRQNSQDHLSLARLAFELLLFAGVVQKNIVFANFCTSCQKDLFFSYRRQSVPKAHLLSFITNNVITS